jgi:hypothetical protein
MATVDAGRPSGASEGPIFRGILFAGTLLLLALLALCFVLVRRGEAAMVESDRAFHAGDLRGAVWEAKEAALAYVPGSAHVRRANDRLEAIARGAAAEGRWDLARLAWDALRLVDEQTDYPGRGPSTLGLEAKQQLAQMGQGTRAGR